MATVLLGLSPIRGVYSQSHAMDLPLIWFCTVSILGLSPIQGVYSQSHAYDLTINLVLLRCLFSVSRPVRVSILNLMIMVLPLIWFCYGYGVARSLAHSGCLFSISRYGFTINLVLLRCLFSVSRPVRVSILNLMLMVLPSIWFCYGFGVSRSLAHSGCLFSISCLWLYH